MTARKNENYLYYFVYNNLIRTDGRTKTIFLVNGFKNPARSDKHLLIGSGRRGAKECKSDSSRHQLSNEYSVVNFGFDPEENDSSNVRYVDG